VGSEKRLVYQEKTGTRCRTRHRLLSVVSIDVRDFFVAQIAQGIGLFGLLIWMT